MVLAAVQGWREGSEWPHSHGWQLLLTACWDLGSIPSGKGRSCRFLKAQPQQLQSVISATYCLKKKKITGNLSKRRRQELVAIFYLPRTFSLSLADLDNPPKILV